MYPKSDYMADGVAHTPWHTALSKRLLHVHVFTLKVNDDDAEIVVLGLTMKILHVGDKLLYPASLVFH